MTHGSLFSGIGGFDLAAEWMGWTNVFHVERDPFCQRVLAHHFPESDAHDDIKTFDATGYAGRIDIITGGFPCQPFSSAGSRKGTADDRHLWPEMLRIVREVSPTYVVAENVRGLLSWSNGLVLDTVCTDLENAGYEVFPVVLGASSVNAPHRRDRIWIVASNACSMGRQRGWSEEAEKREGERLGVQPDVKGQSSGADAPNAVRGGTGDGLRSDRSGTAKVGRGLAEPKLGAQGGDGDATNAHSFRLQQREDAREVGRGQGEVCGKGHQPSQEFASRGKERNAANANGKQLEGRDRKGTPGRSTQPPQRTQSLDGPRTWETFPTVPPVCGRNDGLSTRLDGITFPKWRRESIKAYGNAIVPQVAHQIFRAIEQTEHEIQSVQKDG